VLACQAHFGPPLLGIYTSADAFNDAGQAAFRYSLQNGPTGVSVATPTPEPGSALLLLAGAALLGGRRRARAGSQATA
jgi:hypothetical protein